MRYEMQYSRNSAFHVVQCRPIRIMGSRLGRLTHPIDISLAVAIDVGGAAIGVLGTIARSRRQVGGSDVAM